MIHTKKKLNNNILMEKYKNKNEYPNFVQDCWSRTAIGIYRIGHDCVRIMKWLNYYDSSYYDKMNYFDMMVSICKDLNEIAQR